MADPDYFDKYEQFTSRMMSNLDGGKDTEIARLRSALERIDAEAVCKKVGAMVRMQRIARKALAVPSQHQNHTETTGE